jgi:hypothetical protein
VAALENLNLRIGGDCALLHFYGTGPVEKYSFDFGSSLHVFGEKP